MAFSSRFSKPKAAPAPAPAPAQDEDSDEVESVEADEDASARARKMKEAEEEAARQKTAAEAARRREAADEARQKAEEDKRRREEYEYEKARQETIAKSKKEAAKRAAGGGSGGFGGGGFGGSGSGGGGGFAWKKSSQPQESGAGAASERPAQKPDPRAQNLPSHDECETGVSAMLSRTNNGMKEGLRLLGLPISQLNFIPGQTLQLCGHDVREGINEMIHMWMTDDKDDFNECLLRLREITSKPILTQEEMEMMDNQDDWVQIDGPDGKPRFTRKDKNSKESTPAPRVGLAPKAEEEDSDDEVIDIMPGGTVPTSTPAPAPRPAPAPTPAPAPRPTPTAPAATAPALDEDYYGLLGVPPTATLQEIRTKFRGLVVTEHPEKGGDPKKFQKLNKAYSVLSDQKKRQEYDASRASSGAAARPKKFVD